MKSKERRKSMVGVAILLLLVLGVGGTVLAAGEVIARATPGGSGGGGQVTNGQITLRSAFGQALGDVSATSSSSLCTGFGCSTSSSSSSSDTPITGLTAGNDGPTVLGGGTGFSAGVGTGDNVTYAWDFGDGQTGSGPNPTHTYAAVGSYTATVTAGNGAGSVSAQTTVDVSHVVVQVLNFEFSPKEVTIDPGQRVTWELVAGTHNVVAADGSWSSGPPSSSWTSYSRTFPDPGSHLYYCELHGTASGAGMAGTVTVRSTSPTLDQTTFLPLTSKQ